MFEIQAKKSLGQNFLNNKKIIEKIGIKTGEIIKNIKNKQDLKIIEIGPGTGALTEELLKLKQEVVCIELDDRAIPILKEKFGGNKNFSIKHENIKDSYIDGNYIIVANIPYYLSGFIIRKFLENKNQPQAMLLMVQKEVSTRILDTKNTLLSIGVKTYANPKLFMNVSKGNFTPAPKVDSALILLENIQNEFKDHDFEKKYWHIVKLAFASKRKQIGHNLKEFKDKIDNKYLTKRAEDLSVSDWKMITHDIYYS